jgi:hypothetical protein
MGEKIVMNERFLILTVKKQFKFLSSDYERHLTEFKNINLNRNTFQQPLTHFHANSLNDASRSVHSHELISRLIHAAI